MMGAGRPAVALVLSRAGRPAVALARRSASEVRTYNYVIDHSGAVHLDEPSMARTLATAYRDPKFLDDLYRGLRRRKSGVWAQRCAGELNVLRADTGDADADGSIAVVFRGLDAETDELLFAGTMRQPFRPELLRVSESGEFYHELTVSSGRYGSLGLVGSAVAHSLSSRLADGADGAFELSWGGARHAVRRITFGASSRVVL